jgi:hypothetical protein
MVSAKRGAVRRWLKLPPTDMNRRSAHGPALSIFGKSEIRVEFLCFPSCAFSKKWQGPVLVRKFYYRCKSCTTRKRMVKEGLKRIIFTREQVENAKTRVLARIRGESITVCRSYIFISTPLKGITRKGQSNGVEPSSVAKCQSSRGTKLRVPTTTSKTQTHVQAQEAGHPIRVPIRIRKHKELQARTACSGYLFVNSTTAIDYEQTPSS